MPATAEIPSIRNSAPDLRTAGAIAPRSFCTPVLVSFRTAQTARTSPFSISWRAASTGICWPQGAFRVVTRSQYRRAIRSVRSPKFPFDSTMVRSVRLRRAE